MLTINFKYPVGTYTYKYGGLSLKCSFYDSNTLLVGATINKDVNVIIANMEHLLNCSDLLPKMITNVKLNAAWRNTKNIAFALTQMGIEVTLYYKELQ